MRIDIPDEFKTLCCRIADERKSIDQWAAVESDDMFQTNSFVGGFEATESAFCFSYYDPEGNEHWFQVTLEEVREVAEGRLTNLEVTPAE